MKLSIRSICALGIATLGLSGLAQADGVPKNPPPMTTAPAAQETGFYSALKGGFFWLQDESYSYGRYDADLEFGNGWGITLVPLGYQVCEGFSLSLSAGIYQADIDQVQIHGPAVDVHADVGGEATFVPLMANAVCRVPLIGGLDWYVGVGAGAVYSDVDLDSIRGVRVDAGASDWDFGFQAFSGLAHEITPRSDFHVGYRYLHVSASEEDHQGHAIELGLTIKW